MPSVPAAEIFFFSTRRYDEESFRALMVGDLAGVHARFSSYRLDATTALMAKGATAVCAFVNDVLDRATLSVLRDVGVRLVLLRCAGYNHVDLKAAAEFNILVTRVPAYSPYAVAEHTLGLLLTLNRKIHKAYNRVREGNFSIEGLVGFDLAGKTVGLIGLGKIGQVFASTLVAMGCRVIAYDPALSNVSPGIELVSLDQVWSQSQIISLHCPLTESTRHLINDQNLSRCQRGVFIVNTSRGALINTKDIIKCLKSGQVGALAIDVYEEEGPLFFDDHSLDIISDDVLARLSSFPNVLITGHQAYLTHEALRAIASTTLTSFQKFTDPAKWPNSSEINKDPVVVVAP